MKTNCAFCKKYCDCWINYQQVMFGIDAKANKKNLICEKCYKELSIEDSTPPEKGQE